MEDIVTVKGLASYLKLKEATIRKLASQGNLPAIKIGRSWRFRMNKIIMLFPEKKAVDQTDLTFGNNEGEIPKSELKPFCYGEELRLRADRYPHLRVRVWLFHKRKGEKIFLEHKDMGYVLEARMDDIVWEAYRKTKASE
jgi:excisionase family DNA binding protein